MICFVFVIICECLFLGFIDFIVEPTFSVLIDSTEKIITPLIEEALRTADSADQRSRFVAPRACWEGFWSPHTRME